MYRGSFFSDKYIHVVLYTVSAFRFWVQKNVLMSIKNLFFHICHHIPCLDCAAKHKKRSKHSFDLFHLVYLF